MLIKPIERAREQALDIAYYEALKAQQLSKSKPKVFAIRASKRKEYSYLLFLFNGSKFTKSLKIFAPYVLAFGLLFSILYLLQNFEFSRFLFFWYFVSRVFVQAMKQGHITLN